MEDYLEALWKVFIDIVIIYRKFYIAEILFSPFPIDNEW